MAIDLAKRELSSNEQQRVDVSSGLDRFETIKCVCIWKAALDDDGKPQNTDLDLSSIAFNEKGRIVDHVYSPKISVKMLAHYGMPLGKLKSEENAICHLGDTTATGSEEYQSETIVINLNGVSSDIHRIVFFVNSPDVPFNKLPYLVAGFIGVASDGQEYELGLYNDYEEDRKSLIFPSLEKNNGSWSFVGNFFTRMQDNIGETISSLVNKTELSNGSGPLNNRESTYRLNNTSFNQGDDDEKFGSMTKALLYGFIVAIITAFLRFGYDWIVDKHFEGQAWMILTATVYMGLSLVLGFTVQSQSSYRSSKYPVVGALLILASIIMSDFMFISYIESSYNVYVSYSEYLATLTWWGWLVNIGSIVFVPFFAYSNANK